MLDDFSFCVVGCWTIIFYYCLVLSIVVISWYNTGGVIFMWFNVKSGGCAVQLPITRPIFPVCFSFVSNYKKISDPIINGSEVFNTHYFHQLLRLLKLHSVSNEKFFDKAFLKNSKYAALMSSAFNSRFCLLQFQT